VIAANELRDPHLFKDQDGSKYLLYVGAGEQAIGIASLE
jgi:beta-xylosidase